MLSSKLLLRASARIKKEPAEQVHKKSGRYLTFYTLREKKVSAWELSDIRVLRSQNTSCRKSDSFSTDRIKKSHPADASQLVTCTTHAGGFSVWYVCASNIRVYPGGLLLSIKTFRNPVLKMWVKKGSLSNRAGSISR